jgi:hypothetical protein
LLLREILSVPNWKRGQNILLKMIFRSVHRNILSLLLYFFQLSIVVSVPLHSLHLTSQLYLSFVISAVLSDWVLLRVVRLHFANGLPSLCVARNHKTRRTMSTNADKVMVSGDGNINKNKKKKKRNRRHCRVQLCSFISGSSFLSGGGDRKGQVSDRYFVFCIPVYSLHSHCC